MTVNNYEASVLFKQNYAATAHTVVNQGGTSSGKTYAIIQVLFCLACQADKQVITVVGQDIPNLKAGALRDAQNICNASLQLKAMVKNYSKTDRIFEFFNGSITQILNLQKKENQYINIIKNIQLREKEYLIQIRNLEKALKDSEELLKLYQLKLQNQQ